MKKVYGLSLDEDLVKSVKEKYPHLNFSAFVNTLLKKHMEKNKQ